LLLSLACLGPLAAGPPVEVQLTARDGAASDAFGGAVAFDGHRVIVGAHFDDDAGESSGSAHVFRRGPGGWVQEAKLTASDGAAHDLFGWSVDIDGDRALVGALHWDGSAGDNVGAAYVFRRDGAGWTEEVRLGAGNGNANDSFGNAVALRGDTAVVGAVNGDGQQTDSGSVYVFERSGTQWNEVAKLTAPDGVLLDEFGTSIALSDNFVLIGASQDLLFGTGKAYVFRRVGAGFLEAVTLLPSDGVSGAEFGAAVDLTDEFALVGAPSDDDSGEASGSVYVFERNGAQWLETAKLGALDGDADDAFGISVATDGERAAVGAHFDEEAGDRSGSAYILRRDGADWTEVAKFLADGPNARFGAAGGIESGVAVIGAPGGDSTTQGAGYATILPLVSVSCALRLLPASGPGAFEYEITLENHTEEAREIDLRAELEDPDGVLSILFSADRSLPALTVRRATRDHSIPPDAAGGDYHLTVSLREEGGGAAHHCTGSYRKSFSRSDSGAP
jgi:hypothetical protein